ncbi:MAG: hypothetical protein AAGC46_00830 [Solirubrobacteraceae bacterium]|nr:hypothetical protein [Patulibacter sp.]
MRSAHDHPERIRPFTARENEAAVLGWLAGLETDTWINDPWALPRAELKIEQLRVARRAGLRTPPTVVTGDADAVRTLADAAPDGIIYKSLSDPLVWIGDDAGFLYSTQLGPEHLGELEGLLRHVGLFQARIRARSELRVTVVGEMTFSVRVRAPDLDQVDWRRGLDRRQLRYEVIVLDDDLHRRILATVGALGLTYAAVDLIEDDAGWVFLEVNPAGAYRWLETGLDLPITPAICDLLLAT